MTPPPPLPIEPSADERQVVLAETVEEYVGAARAMRSRDLREFQHPPYSSVAFGAAGIAYALWRHDPSDPAAVRWLDAADRFPPADAWLTPSYPTTLDQRRGSLATGPPGVAWVRLLMAITAGQAVSARHWSRVLVATGADGRPSEFLLGDAGHLTALAVAADRAAASPIGRLTVLDGAVGELHRRLAPVVLAPSFGGESLSFARGRLGVHHALLVAHRRAGTRPDPDELDALARLADEVSSVQALGDPLRRSWCNGTTGAVLTWIQAFRVTGDPGWLDLARRDAKLWDEPLDPDDDPGTLCCGSGGWAQACLELHTVLPDDGWHDRALTLAVQAFDHLDSPWQHGLLRGYPGLVCLALDAVATSPQGFPLVSA